jgi:hypothetical protein
MARRLLCRRKNITDQIDFILSDHTNGGHKLFKDFAEDEFSSENILIWEDIQNYKKLKDASKREILANEIFTNYLSGVTAPLEGNLLFPLIEVNVNSKTVDSVINCLKTNDFSDEMFEQCLSQIRINMSDTFSRFQLSPGYMLYSNKVCFF